MARSVWSGTLSFGLVAIPVKLFPATEPKDVRFHLVDAESGRRVRYRRMVEEEDAGWPDAHSGLEDDEAPGAPDRTTDRATDPDTDRETDRATDGTTDRATETEREGEPDATSPPGTGGSAPPGAAEPFEREVPFEGLARGFEVEPGVMVTLTPEEIRSIRPTPSHTIEIEDFVELDAIDPAYFEKSYLVAPQAGGAGERPYALLLKALERAGRVGIGRFVLRTKPHLVAIRPRAGALGLETLFFDDEVRDPSKVVPAEGVAIGERELTMADQLIDMLAVDWDPSRYADTYREELRALIAGKTPRREPEARSVATGGGGPSDAERLMDALRESVERAKGRTEDTGRPGRRGGASRTG